MRTAQSYFAAKPWLAAGVLLFFSNQAAIGAQPKKGFQNPIATACAKLLAPLEKPLRDKKPWKISPETEAQIQTLWTDATLPYTLDQRLAKQHDLLLEDRLQQTNPVSRAFMRSAMNNAIRQKSIYSRTLGWLVGRRAGPHYHPIFNRSQQLPLAPVLDQDSDIVDLTVSIHELEHAYHRNTRPGLVLLQLWTLPLELQFLFFPTPITPLTQFRMESRALGSQWEFVHRLPPEVRQFLIQQLETRDKMAKILEVSQEGKDGTANAEKLLADLLEELKRDHGDEGLQRYAELRRLFDQLKEWKVSHPSMLRALIRISLSTLQNADLSKEEFLEKQAVVHNYTLESLIRNHYRFGGIRIYMALVGLTNIGYWAWQGAHGLPHSHLHDVDLLIRVFATLTGN